MRPTADEIDDGGQELAARVAELVEERDRIAPAVEAFASELPAGTYRRELCDLVVRLRRGETADQLCRAPTTTAALLPLLSAASPGRHRHRLPEIFAESARENELRMQRNRVIAYPVVLLLLAAIVSGFLISVVVPVFDEIFRSFGLELPLLTEVLLSTSGWVRRHPIWLAVVLAGCGAAICLLWRLSSWGWCGVAKDIVTRGSAGEVSAMAAFAHRLAEGLAAPLSLPVALRVAGACSDRPGIRNGARQLADDAVGGADSFRASRAAGRFPSTMIWVIAEHAFPADADGGNSPAVADGGSTPMVVRMLEEIADVYSERVRHRVDGSSGIVAQSSILLVGFLVGGVLLAVLLPLVQLVGAFS